MHPPPMHKKTHVLVMLGSSAGLSCKMAVGMVSELVLETEVSFQQVTLRGQPRSSERIRRVGFLRRPET